LGHQLTAQELLADLLALLYQNCSSQSGKVTPYFGTFVRSDNSICFLYKIGSRAAACAEQVLLVEGVGHLLGA
jgi:hypothetical protein